jgi:stress-induced morphogen
MFDPQEIERLIKASLPDAQVFVRDLTGGGDHFSVSVKSDAFREKSIVEQHQMIYRALGSAMDGPIHALQIATSTL